MALPRRQVTHASCVDDVRSRCGRSRFRDGRDGCAALPLDLRVDPASKSLSGIVELRAKVVSPTPTSGARTIRSGPRRRTVRNDRSEQTFDIPVGDAVETVAVDPDDWILKHVTDGASP